MIKLPILPPSGLPGLDDRPPLHKALLVEKSANETGEGSRNSYRARILPHGSEHFEPEMTP